MNTLPRALSSVVAAALLAPLLALVLGLGTAPSAGAQPTGLGGGYSQLLESELERGGLGGSDSGELRATAAECAAGTPANVATDRAGLGYLAEKEFLACMAEEGFGQVLEDDDGAVQNLSLDAISASLTGFYVSELAPAEDGASAYRAEGPRDGPGRGLDAWAQVLSHPAQAGAFVGALDRSDDDEDAQSSEWLFGPGNASNTAEVRYASFSRDLNTAGNRGWLGAQLQGGGVGLATDTTGELVPDAGVEAYLTYGALLSGLGLDTTSQREEGLRGVFSSSGMRGYSMLVAYMAAGAVDVFFDTVLEALQWLNPFRFMVEAVAENTSDHVAAGMTGQPAEQDGLFDGLRALFSQIYSALVSIGWMIVVPLLLVMLLLGMTMVRSAQTGSRAKRLVVIVVFMILGLPLLGTLYTAGLTAMAGATADSARANATKVVASTLIDFEAWVTQSRLAPPPVLENSEYFAWNGVTNMPIGQSEAMVRRLAESLNASHTEVAGLTAHGPVDPRQNIDIGDDRTWATTVINRPGDGSPVGDAALGLSSETFGATRDLIMRYANGATISAAAYESEVKLAFDSAIRHSSDPARAESAVAGWFEELVDPQQLAGMTGADVARLSNPLIQVAPGSGLGARPQGAGDDEESAWAYQQLSPPDCDLSSGAATGVVPAGWDGSPDGALVPCGLSVMSMYNYLNTSFGSTSMETFSPSSTASGYVRVNHAAVSSVGAGPAGILYFFSAMTVLGSFVIIGFLYAMGLMFSSIKRAFSLVGAALGSAVGLLSAIAKVAVLTAALFIELFATLFLYKLVQEFIVIVPTILEKPLAERLSSAPAAGGGVGNTGTAQMISGADPESQWGAAAAAAGAAVSLADQRSLGIVALMITLVTTAALLMFTFMAVKLRRGLLDTIDQGVTNLVNKFTDTQVEGGMAPSEPGALRTGLSRGGSMAMTSMMVGREYGASHVDTAADETDVGPGGEPETTTTITRRIERSNGSVTTETEHIDAQGRVTMSETATGGQPDGAPGTGGSGAMTVASGGQVLDAAGNPVPRLSGGGAATVADLVPVDRASGHVLDTAGGSPVLGADGSPLSVESVAGFDDQGRMVDERGQVLQDAAGSELSSPEASTTAARLMGDEALARSVMSNGLSQPGGQMISPLAGRPISDEAAVAGASGPAIPDPTSAHKLPGETPVSDGAGGRSLGKTFATAAAGGIASVKLSGQRRRTDLYGARGSRGGPIPKRQ